MTKSYFRRLPSFEYVSRNLEKRTLSDYSEVKNLFVRGKIREDIFKNLKYFTRYDITGDERPDQVANKIYGDPTLDWVVLLSNNILNVYDEWPKTQYGFEKYLLEKYGSYEKIYDVHHYETIEYKSGNEITIIPAGKYVNEDYYKAPQYKVETDTTIGLPQIIPGTFAAATASINNTRVSNVTLVNSGIGYTNAFIRFSDPPVAVTGIASAVLSVVPGEREVGSITLVDSGRGYYLQAPQVTFADPPATIPGIATASIGVGGSVTSVSIGNSGEGYTFTPTVSFSQPNDILGGAIYLSTSSITLNQFAEGSYISPDGIYFYTAHGSSGMTQGFIYQYTLSTPWDMSTATLTNTLTLNLGGITFNYASGIEFRPTGKRFYVSGLTNSGYKIVSYNLTTEWDLSTAVYFNNTSVPSPAGIRFRDDGKEIFIVDESDSYKIKKYRLLTAWNISTLYDVLQTEDLSGLVNDPTIYGFTFSDDGTELYVSGVGNAKIYLLKLTTAWDLSSLVPVSSLDVSGTDTWPVEMFLRTDRKRLYFVGDSTSKIYTYDIDLLAEGYATILNEKLNQIVITKPGGGYLEPPTVTIQPPIPARRATGYALVSQGKITQFILTDGGYNYRTVPSITIEDPPEPTRAEGRAITQNGQVISLEITNPGNGYDVAPEIIFSSPENLYEPSLDEVFEVGGQEWKFDGYNWRKRLSFGTLYYDEFEDKIIEIEGKVSSKPITNFEYEQSIEDKKRNIYLLKPDYLNILFDDIETMMTYQEGSEQYLSRTLKRGDNPRFYE